MKAKSQHLTSFSNFQMDFKRFLPMTRKTKKWLYLFVGMVVTEEGIDLKTYLEKASEIPQSRAKDLKEH